jgi:hypothetical protein
MMHIADAKYWRRGFSLAVIATMVGSSVAARDDDDEGEGKHKRRHHAPYVTEPMNGYYGPRVNAPPVIIYSPPPVLVYPPPTYAPYQPPDPPSLNINIPLR